MSAALRGLPAGDAMSVLGVQEFSDTAVGLVALDAATKAAPVTVLGARVANPGKLLTFITGDEASVELALAAGRRNAEGALLDELFLPHIHPEVAGALAGSTGWDAWDAMGVIEASTVAGGIGAADRAAKRASVRVAEIRIDDAMGGRASVRLLGPVGEVDAGLDAAREYLEARGTLVRAVRIANPHDDLRVHLAGKEE